MTDLSALSSAAASGTASARRHAHHAGTGQFQSLMTSLGAGTGTSPTAATSPVAATSQTAASGAASTGASGMLGGLQHVLDLLQGVTA